MIASQIIRLRIFSFACALSLGLLFVQAAAAQAVPGSDPAAASNSFEALDLPHKAEVALDRIQRNDVGAGIVDATYYIETGAHADPKRVIPVLEAYFDRSHEQDLQNELASVLVSIGDTDPRFWNLILALAKAAIDSDVPDPFGMENPAGPSQPCASSALHGWASANNLSVEDACRQATMDIPQKLLPLAHTGDPRAVPVLQEALKSRNSLIQSIAVQGLVLTQDRDSVTLILALIQRVSHFQAQSLASILIESNDPRTDAIVRQYMPDVNLADAKQFRAKSAEWRRPLLTRQ